MDFQIFQDKPYYLAQLLSIWNLIKWFTYVKFQDCEEQFHLIKSKYMYKREMNTEQKASVSKFDKRAILGSR